MLANLPANLIGGPSGLPWVTSGQIPNKVVGRGRAALWGIHSMGNGSTFGDTFWVAKLVRGCQNLAYVQANNVANSLPERAIFQVLYSRKQIIAI